MIIQRLFSTIMAALVLVIVCSPVQGAADDEWKLRITPYFFAPAADYDATASGTTASIDLSFSDIWDNFDVFGGAVLTEAWKGEWGIVFDGYYVDLDGEFGPNDSIDVDLKDAMVDLLAAYRIETHAFQGQTLFFDILPGLRYHYLKQEITPDLPGPLPSVTQGGSEDWIEPVIGGRVVWPFAEKWTLAVGGDMGGFGIGSASDLTWSINTGLDFKFSEKWSIAIAYRYFDMDYSKGSGSNEFGFDGSMDGVMIGLTWRN